MIKNNKTVIEPTKASITTCEIGVVVFAETTASVFPYASMKRLTIHKYLKGFIVEVDGYREEAEQWEVNGSEFNGTPQEFLDRLRPGVWMPRE